MHRAADRLHDFVLPHDLILPILIASLGVPMGEVLAPPDRSPASSFVAVLAASEARVIAGRECFRCLPLTRRPNSTTTENKSVSP